MKKIQVKGLILLLVLAVHGLVSVDAKITHGLAEKKVLAAIQAKRGQTKETSLSALASSLMTSDQALTNFVDPLSVMVVILLCWYAFKTIKGFYDHWQRSRAAKALIKQYEKDFKSFDPVTQLCPREGENKASWMQRLQTVLPDPKSGEEFPPQFIRQVSLFKNFELHCSRKTIEDMVNQMTVTFDKALVKGDFSGEDAEANPKEKGFFARLKSKASKPKLRSLVSTDQARSDALAYFKYMMTTSSTCLARHAKETHTDPPSLEQDAPAPSDMKDLEKNMLKDQMKTVQEVEAEEEFDAQNPDAENPDEDVLEPNPLESDEGQESLVFDTEHAETPAKVEEEAGQDIDASFLIIERALQAGHSEKHKEQTKLNMAESGGKLDTVITVVDGILSVATLALNVASLNGLSGTNPFSVNPPVSGVDINAVGLVNTGVTITNYGSDLVGRGADKNHHHDEEEEEAKKKLAGYRHQEGVTAGEVAKKAPALGELPQNLKVDFNPPWAMEFAEKKPSTRVIEKMAKSMVGRCVRGKWKICSSCPETGPDREHWITKWEHKVVNMFEEAIIQVTIWSNLVSAVTAALSGNVVGAIESSWSFATAAFSRLTAAKEPKNGAKEKFCKAMIKAGIQLILKDRTKDRHNQSTIQSIRDELLKVAVKDNVMNKAKRFWSTHYSTSRGSSNDVPPTVERTFNVPERIRNGQAFQ